MSIGKPRTCQNCKQEFTIEPEDFRFYEKMDVPAPTFCPDCRFQRRMAFRNESNLYQRRCDLCKRTIICMYHPDTPFPVYCSDCWWSDKWDPLGYGQEYDFSRPFFEQFRELTQKVSQLSFIGKNNVNSDYSNYSLANKNCYLIFGSHYNEDSMYSWYNFEIKDCMDTLDVIKSELVYEGNFDSKLYKCAFVEYTFNSNECFFCYDLKGCNNCFFSYNLRNQHYCIFNKPYAREEYKKKITEFDTGSYATLEKLKAEFSKLKLKAIRRFTYHKNAVNSTGDDLREVKNIRQGFNVEYSEDCIYAYPKITVTYDSMDTGMMGYDRSELCYETICCTALTNGKFGVAQWQSHNVEYGNTNFSSHDLFGCNSLKHKSYCILNKRYTKDSFVKLKAKIIKHMDEMPYIDRKGRIYKYGEFFPIELSPFAYNESMSPEYHPLSKKDALSNGYRWRDPEAKEYQKQTYKIPDHIKDVKDDILQAMLACIDCGKNYRVIKPELTFYQKQNFPIPRKCFQCRHSYRLSQRNPVKLWHRRCQCVGSPPTGGSENGIHKNTIEHFHKKEHCPNEFETSYAPERPEIVYCEQCYLQEIA